MNDENRIPPPPPSNEIPKPPEKKEARLPAYSLEKGKVPPQARDLEIAVLGALLIDSTAALEIMEYMTPEVFFVMEHQTIFKAIQTLYEEDKPIDLLTVSEELRRTGNLARAGGDYNLVQLSQKTGSAANIDWHSRVSMQKYVLRRMIMLGNIVIEEAYHEDPDIFDLMDKFTDEVSAISNVALKGQNDHDTDASEELQNKVKLKREGATIGFPTGMEDFDNWCGGFLRRWLVILGARPGMGKTSAVLAIIYHMAFIRSIKVVFFSLEMSKIDLQFRLAARMTDIPFEKINLGELTDEELDKLTQAINSIESYGIKIVDNITNLNQIVSETRKLKAEGYEVFFLDYLQLVEISGSSKDLTGEMVIITRTFKSLKNELNIPFVALSQIDRIADKREGHRPQLSDLKQASSIEQDADMVAFLLRPEYYNKNKSKIPLPPGKPNPEYIAEWIVAKGRSTGLRDFDIYLDLSKFILKSGGSVPF